MLPTKPVKPRSKPPSALGVSEYCLLYSSVVANGSDPILAVRNRHDVLFAIVSLSCRYINPAMKRQPSGEPDKF